jgi:hypothetical protein
MNGSDVFKKMTPKQVAEMAIALAHAEFLTDPNSGVEFNSAHNYARIRWHINEHYQRQWRREGDPVYVPGRDEPVPWDPDMRCPTCGQ